MYPTHMIVQKLNEIHIKHLALKFVSDKQILATVTVLKEKNHKIVLKNAQKTFSKL